MSTRNGEDVPDDMPVRSIRGAGRIPHGEPIPHHNLKQTARIVDARADESLELIDELFDRIYRPENIYEHRWRMGDFVMWGQSRRPACARRGGNVGHAHAQRVFRPARLLEQHPQFTKEQFATT